MVAVASKVVLLLAVLIQYTPVRVCAIERAAFGANCHEWAASVSNDVSNSGWHNDEHGCDSRDGNDRSCICELPKVDANHPSQDASITLDLSNLSIAVVIFDVPVTPLASAIPDPDPHRDLLASLQLPLLI